MRDKRSPCAADALFGTRSITVNGRTVGIARLCDAIAAVQAMDLSGDDRIRAALLSKVEADNYIPEPLRAAYADALLAEYRAAAGKCPQETRR